MSSIDERIVVETAHSLGSTSSTGGEGTSNSPDKASRRRLLARINADEARLIAEGRPWYEVRASLLQESDKAIIKDLSVRQQDVGKFFIRLKPELGFIKGNPTSHKGWMNQYFFLSRNAREGVAWHCDMSWSKKPTKRTPPLPAQEYDPTNFLNVMSVKCFNAQELIQKDLLCHFADRIMKAQLLKAYKQQWSKVTKSPSPHPEERTKGHTKEKRKGSPSRNDKQSRKKSSSTTVAGDVRARILTRRSRRLWLPILCRRVSTAQEVARTSRRSMDDVLVQHEKLTKELEEVRGSFDVEKRCLMDRLLASEAAIACLREEVQKVQEEAEATWAKKKEDFLKSSAFDELCSTRALSFFEQGFNRCLAQFRANGYSETEHPAPFLSVLKALEDLPEEGKVGSSSAPEK
ncbi:hypothetical protein F511_07531 [Dorcoceras hygrometricum]|uniref:Uncharacterized protein n=1 Tax=Dorcoceras hygrometricum TaxID=472368 RepID=A0A2Z7B3K9_9LAMI|nr:hypothetical protein F511_07531 [Dorcoceras hygrometricum]